MRHCQMGEFAIGTNTTAYRMARDFDIADKLPILIAEKTGPHFAVGDTCYSHEEDMVTYNPDGKQIVARENDFSKLRSEDMSKHISTVIQILPFLMMSSTRSQSSVRMERQKILFPMDVLCSQESKN